MFTEDHAALTGARELVIANELKPERSWNANLSYVKNWVFNNQTYLQLDASAWFTHFTNKIAPDYDTDVQKIIYDNIDGYAQSKGVSANVDISFPNGMKFLIGGTWQNVQKAEEGVMEHLEFAERFSGNWMLSLPIKKWNMTLDYTGTLTGPMNLPTLGENDPRRDVSSTFALHHIQATYRGLKNFEIYAGVKNLTNWTVSKTVPFLIANSNDPFDKNVSYNPDGSIVKTKENPYGLSFDPTYIYGTNQGIRGIIGVRYQLF
ncbi:TonB-dependent receptor domain-containing protein [Capnocytophaga sp. ARDL2]|uniref:TonB-dependent receptor domain-containing protein n=1 Tax=Capnocytophaga sp. ARDL2 TaxID=3238809 RepID=UPI003558BBC7